MKRRLPQRKGVERHRIMTGERNRMMGFFSGPK